MSDLLRRVRPALAAVVALLAGIAAASPPPVPPAGAARGAGETEAQALLRAADAPRRLISEGAIQVRATVEEPGTEPVVSDLEVLVQGEERSLCLFRGGPFAGRRILANGSKVWLIFPGTTRPVAVSPSQRLVGGASIADVARLRFEGSFEATLRPGEEADESGVRCLVLDLKAREKSVPYASGTLWIGAADRLPRRVLFRLRSGMDAKEVRFASYEKTKRGVALRREEILHLLPNEKGWRTVLEYLGEEARSLDPALFTPEHAREAV
jgi:hypothetical protein